MPAEDYIDLQAEFLEEQALWTIEELAIMDDVESTSLHCDSTDDDLPF